MRRHVIKVANFSALLLLVGIISPLQTASSVDIPMVTKTFTVHDRNDAPLAGALVQLRYYDVSVNRDDWTYTSIVTTDVAGVAVISLPQSELLFTAQIEPPVDNLADAVFTSIPNGTGALNASSSSSISVRLKSSDLKVKLVKSDNSDAPIRTRFNYPLQTGESSRTASWILRSGGFGVALTQSLTIGTNYMVRINRDFNTTLNQFDRAYGLKVNGLSPNLAPVIYSNVSNITPLTADNGVYTLALDAGNIEGQLKTSDGVNYTLPSVVHGRILEISKINVDGTFDYSQNTLDVGANVYAPIDSNGHFYGRIRGLLAGRYLVRVNLDSSAQVPTFNTDLWVNPSGGFSLTENGTYSNADPFTLNLSVPAPNLVLHTVDASTGLAVPGYISIDKGLVTDYFSADFNAAVGSFSLPNGEYVLNFYQDSAPNPGNFKVSVVAGVATLSDAQDHPLTRSSDGSYSISAPLPTPPNFLYHLQSSSGAALANQYVDACHLDANGNCANDNLWVNSTSDASGNGSLGFGDGSFRLSLRPAAASGLAEISYTISVASGVVTINNPNPTVANTRLTLVAPTANLQFKVVSPADVSTGLSGFGGSICPDPYSSGAVCFKADVSSTGLMNFKVPPGTYRMYLYTNGPNLNYLPNSYNFSIAVDGAITFTDPIPTFDSGIGRYIVSPKIPVPPNFLYHLQSPSGTPLANQFVNACHLDANGNCANDNLGVNSMSDASGNGSLGFENGSFQLFINPNAASGLAAINYTITVAGGVVTIIDPNPAVANGRLTLVAPTANLFLELVNPTNTSQLLTNGYVYACRQSGSGGACPTVNSGASGFANFALLDGTYSLTVMDFAPNTTFAQKTYQVSVLNGVVSFVGETPPLNTVTNRLKVWPSSSNILFTIKDPVSSAAIANASVNFCLVVNNGTGACGYSNGTDVSGNSAAYITDGTYKLTVNPPQNSSLSARVYDATVSNSGATISITGATQSAGRWILTPAQPNVRGTFIDGSNNSGNLLAFSPGKGVSITLQKQDGINWIYQNINAWKTTASWGLNLTQEGVYRIAASPFGFSDFSETFSAAFTFSPNVSTPSIPIVFRSSNLKMLIRNPLDNSLLRSGWVQIEQLLADRTNWISNSNIDFKNPGVASARLDDGNYRITVMPPQGDQSIAGLAAKTYLVTVSASGATVVVTDNGSPIAADPDTHRFLLSAASANITARLVDSSGAPITLASGGTVQVNVQKWNDGSSYWEYGSIWAQSNNDGFIGISMHETGKYRLRLSPSGRSDLVSTDSPEFTISAQTATSFVKNFGDIKLGGPSIRVKIVLPAGGEGIPYSWVEIRKNGQWLDWTNAGANGVAAIALPDSGAYEFVVHPSGDGSSGLVTGKSYVITAVKDGSTGVVSATANGISAVSGVFTLPLGVPTLSGTVNDPLGNTLANSQIVAIDSATNQEMWQNSVSSNQSGQWSMLLPAGTYKLSARSPWGNSQFGNSDLLGDFIVDANGVSTGRPAGVSSNAVLLSLKAPTWSGVVKSPDGTSVIPRASICFVATADSQNSCSTTDALGRFAISAPTGFTAFDEGSSLHVQEGSNAQYSAFRLQGATAVFAALGSYLGSNRNNIVLTLLAPNTSITVTAAGLPVANTWVSFERDGIGWMGGGVTNSQGVARVNIVNPELGFTARADVSNSSYSNAYTSTTAVFPAAALTSGVYVGTIALLTPNVRGVLREPTSSGSAIVPFTNTYLIDDLTGRFIGSSNVDATGYFSFNAPAPVSGVARYTLTVNPAWNTTSANTSQTYAVVVDTLGNATLTVKNTGQAVSTETRDGLSGTIYSFSLTAPSVVGAVVGSNGSSPIANSWINVSDAVTGQYVNSGSNNSRLNGVFSLALADGSYDLQANVPWGSTNISNSARCRITVVGLQVTSPVSTCVRSDKSILLALRSPNLSFTVVNGSNVIVPNANVNVWSGSWSTWAQADRNGRVSLFVDSDAIKLATGASDGASLSLHVLVDPPYGDSSITRWQCDSAQTSTNCASIPNVTIGQAYPTTALSTSLAFPSPNVRLRVLKSDGTPVGAGGWVSIYQIPNLSQPNNRNWISSGATDSQGYAGFAIDPSASNLVVEVGAPYSDRSTSASMTYTNNLVGYTLAAINNAEFRLGSPNLKLTVKGALNEVNKWGWIGVEKLESGQIYSWFGNFGSDELGKVNLLLPSSSTFRITMNAGNGSSGAQTICKVTTNASGVVSLTDCPNGLLTGDSLAVTLGSGNVVGTVLAPDSTPVANALVYANILGATSEDSAITTTTTPTGRFGLNLNSALQWVIKIFPPQAAVGQAQLANLTSGVTVPIHSSGSVSDLGSISLAAL